MASVNNHPLCKFDDNVTKIHVQKKDILEIPKCMSKYKKLEELVLSKNFITKIENLDGLENLKSLALNDNKIEKIENLDNLKNLELLSLDDNHIKKIENLGGLDNLKVVSLKYNWFDNIECVRFKKEMDSKDFTVICNRR